MMPAGRDESPLWPLTAQLAMLSMMAIGGGVIMLAPDVHRFVVDAHRWITDGQFAAAYTIAQIAPGPNMLYVTLIGWQVAGIAGAVLATLAVVAPPVALTFLLLRLGGRRTPGPLGRAVRKGLAPVSIGLLLAGGWILARASDGDWRGGLVSAVTVVTLTRSKLNPVWLIAAGAALGLAGIV